MASTTRVIAPVCTLGDSHISLQFHPELPAAMDSVELLDATPHGDGAWRLVVAVPATEASDDPTRPRQTAGRVRVLPSLGAALEVGNQRLDGVDFRLGEDG